MSISTSSSPRSRPVGPIHTVVAVRVVLAIERSAAHRLAGLSELLDNRRAERRKVRRRAAGGQLPVDDDLLIQDLSAGTTQVAPQARPGREPAASHRVGLQQRPRAVTHRSDRLTCRHEGLHEVDRFAIDPAACLGSPCHLEAPTRHSRPPTRRRPPVGDKGVGECPSDGNVPSKAHKG